MIANVSATIRSRGLGLAAVLALPFAFVGCSSGGDIAADAHPERRPAHRGLRLRPSRSPRVRRRCARPVAHCFCKAETITAGSLGGYSQGAPGAPPRAR